MDPTAEEVASKGGQGVLADCGGGTGRRVALVGISVMGRRTVRGTDAGVERQNGTTGEVSRGKLSILLLSTFALFSSYC